MVNDVDEFTFDCQALRTEGNCPVSSACSSSVAFRIASPHFGKLIWEINHRCCIERQRRCPQSFCRKTAIYLSGVSLDETGKFCDTAWSCAIATSVQVLCSNTRHHRREGQSEEGNQSEILGPRSSYWSLPHSL